MKNRCDFFLSSRRRHTRWPRDWSSDVCSSDLILHNTIATIPKRRWLFTLTRYVTPSTPKQFQTNAGGLPLQKSEIGRASWREREKKSGRARSTRTTEPKGKRSSTNERHEVIRQ